MCTQLIQSVLEHGSVITGAKSYIDSFSQKILQSFFREKMHRDIIKIKDTTNAKIVSNALEDAVCLG